ncbi:MAG: MraY family glycosyltransferase [Candidatus Moranbacteria bacterium]|nr:MraY family glycosyltransferase [Candidatus Moranbacteria bacterium]
MQKAQPSSRRRLSLRRTGGVAVILVFVILVSLDRNLIITRPIAGILTGGAAILFFGLLDDIKNLNWKWQLLFQIIIALIAISFGVRSDYVANPLGGVIPLTNPIVYTILYTLYFILFLNSLNWLDGTDGVASGVTLASLATIFFLSFKPEVNQPAVAILAAIAGGATLGFLVFNFPPARIFAGTGGAWFFGFILASLSIFAGAKIATVMMAALIPILDFGRVTWERWRSGGSIFKGDNRHLHYQLVERGWSEQKIFWSYFSASILIGILALHLNAMGKLAIMGIVAVAYFYFISFFQVRHDQ